MRLQFHKGASKMQLKCVCVKDMREKNKRQARRINESYILFPRAMSQVAVKEEFGECCEVFNLKMC